MKKLFCLLIILCIPILVLADAGGPSIMSYKAVVINPNGVKVDDKVVPYNAQITIDYEYVYEYGQESENADFASFTYCVKKDDCISGSISFKDFLPVEKEIIPSGKEKKDEDWGAYIAPYKTTVVVFNKNGIKLKKGPAAIYEEYDKVVPYDTTLEVTYAVSSYGEHGSEYYPWYYVDSGEYKGWIDNTGMSESSGLLVKTSGIIAYGEIRLVDENNKTIKKFSTETELKDVYYSDYDDYGHYIKYEGVWRKIVGNYFGNTNGYLLTTKETSLTTSDGVIKATIPFGTKVRVLSYGGYSDSNDYYHSYCYVEYGNQKGFVSANDGLVFDKDEIQDIKIKLAEDTNLYGYTNCEGDWCATEAVLSTIPKGTELKAYYEYYGQYIVIYDHKVGIVNLNPPEDDEQEDVNPTNPNKEEKEENNPKLKTQDIILYSLIGAAIISITSIVTILLVNKKKKNKKEKVVEMPQEEKIEKVIEAPQEEKSEINEVKEEEQK